MRQVSGGERVPKGLPNHPNLSMKATYRKHSYSAVLLRLTVLAMCLESVLAVIVNCTGCGYAYNSEIYTGPSYNYYFDMVPIDNCAYCSAPVDKRWHIGAKVQIKIEIDLDRYDAQPLKKKFLGKYGEIVDRDEDKYDNCNEYDCWYTVKVQMQENVYKYTKAMKLHMDLVLVESELEQAIPEQSMQSSNVREHTWNDEDALKQAIYNSMQDTCPPTVA